MHNKYNEKISDMKKCIQKKNKLNLLLKQTEQDIIKEKLLLNKLSGELEKEYQDVLKLKSDSIISLFHEILGTEEDKHSIEKQRLLKARLKYEQCKNNMNYLVDETKKIVDCIAKDIIQQSDNAIHCQPISEEQLATLFSIMVSDENLGGDLNYFLDNEYLSKGLRLAEKYAQAGMEVLCDEVFEDRWNGSTLSKEYSDYGADLLRFIYTERNF
jgi:hypothetical protein